MASYICVGGLQGAIVKVEQPGMGLHCMDGYRMRKKASGTVSWHVWARRREKGGGRGGGALTNGGFDRRRRTFACGMALPRRGFPSTLCRKRPSRYMPWHAGLVAAAEDLRGRREWVGVMVVMGAGSGVYLYANMLAAVVAGGGGSGPLPAGTGGQAPAAAGGGLSDRHMPAHRALEIGEGGTLQG